jgi:2-oxoglutarate ferredoxin oxidoreductase subunit beta
MSCKCGDKTKAPSYLSTNILTWCTNCGNYGIQAAVRRALAAENIPPCKSLLCFDIGCNGNGADKIEGYRFHGLHGRIIPFACGAAVANQDITTIAFAGDGATLAEGVGHLVSAVRTNYNITFILHNNMNYGLTTGQASPTTRTDMAMNSSPDGPTSEAIHPIKLVMALNPSFVARTFSGNVKHMTDTIRQGIQHRGFSFIEVLQSCPTYNKATPHEWYIERVFDVSSIENYDPTNFTWASEISTDIMEKIAIGVLYKNPKMQCFSDKIEGRKDIATQLIDEVKAKNISSYLEAFK